MLMNVKETIEDYEKCKKTKACCMSRVCTSVQFYSMNSDTTLLTECCCEMTSLADQYDNIKQI